MPTETGTIDLKAQKAGHDDAAQTATNYVTEVGEHGIKIHGRGLQAIDYQAMTPDGSEIFQLTESVAKFGAKTRIGSETGSNQTITASGYSYNQGENSVFAIEPYGDENATVSSTTASATVNANSTSSSLQAGPHLDFYGLTMSEVTDYINSSGMLLGTYKYQAYRVVGSTYVRIPTRFEILRDLGPDDDIDAALAAVDYYASAETAVFEDQADPTHVTGALSYRVSNNTSTAISVVVGVGVDVRPVRTRIGKKYVEGATDNESHLELDYHSMQMVNKDGIAYMHVSDLRDESGKAHIELGMQRTFSRHAIFDISDYANYTNVVVSVVNPLSGDITSQCEITVTGILQEPAFSVIIDVPNSISILPSYGLYVYISLDTDAHYVPESAMAFTLGSRSKSASNRIGGGSVSFGRQNNSGGLFGFASGQLNYVSGECAASLGAQCSAIGKHSVAMNYGTDASSDSQTVLGAYNKPDVIGKYALIVGNGTAGNARSNAAVIDWNGNGEFAGDVTDGSGNVLSDKADSSVLAAYLPLAGGDVTGNLSVQSWAGVIQMFAGTTPPNGWLLCDGSAVSRTTYATLFAAIGDTWGAGDGSTTFNLPDFRGRAPIGAGTGTGLSARTLGGTVGAETVTLTAGESGLPAHTHAFSNVLTNPETVARRTVSSGSGATNHLYSSGATSRANTTGAVSGGAKDATTAHNNMQPSAVVNFIIHTGKTS